MKSILLVAIVLGAFSRKEYGLYRLYRQVGGLIYDFSGNNFHGRNGNNILEDPNDGVFTDRGIYLDGISSYFLIHSDDFGAVPVFVTEWSFSVWIFAISTGPVLHRISDQGNTSFKIVSTLSSIYVEFNNCTSTCVLNNFNLNHIYPINTWFLLSMEIFDEDDIQFFENPSMVITHATGMKYEDNDSFSYTYMGTDSSSFLNAFFYYIRVNIGPPVPQGISSSVADGCDGYCYFNSSPHPQCTCSSCSHIRFKQCLSQCDDYTLASDCSTDASSCPGIYSLTDGCGECPQDKWPVCDVEFPVDLSSILCHSSCRGCKGPTSSDCLGCSALYMNLNSGTCECPLNSSLVDSECVCSSPYIMLTSGSSYSCSMSCSWPCLECSGVDTFCTSCVQTSANLDSSGVCSCPSNSSSTISSCECDTGFVLQMVGNTFECSSCLFPCLECSGTPDTCTSCSSSFNLSGASCVCPSSSTLELNQCTCDAGFFLSFDSEYECIVCSSPCQDCSGGSTSCTACLPSFNLDGTSCVCPLGSAVVSNECVCSSGFLLSAVLGSQNQFECVKCSEPCSECSGSPSSCTKCLYASSILQDGTCVCPEKSSLVSEECVCDEGFKMKDSECVKKEEETVLNSFDSLESLIISLIIAIVIVSTFLISDPSSVWIILNNIQLLSYLPFHAFDLPGTLERTCNAFKLSSILPNLSLLLFGEDLETHGVPDRWIEKGTTRAHFFLNIGPVLLVLLLNLCYLIIVSILTCANKDKYGKYLKEFRYNIVLRLWIEIFIEVLFASLISWNSVLIGRLGYENIIGGAVFLIQILSVFLLWKKLHSITEHSEETQENIKDRYSCLFYEFDDEKSVDIFMFYIYFLIRRFVYLFDLFYLSSYPVVQLLLNLSCSVIQILLLIIQVKFKDKLNQIVSIIVEILFVVIFMLILYFNSDISDEERAIADYSSIGVLGLMVATLLINHIAKIVSSCSSRCRKRQNVVIDESAIAKFKNEDSVIFSLPYNRRDLNRQISLNLEDVCDN